MTFIQPLTMMLDTPLFYKLHDAWVCSNYNSNLKPSIDRTNCYLPYTKDNIKLMTWKENRDKGLTEKLENRGSGWGKGSPLVKVNQLDKCGSFIVKFNSIKEAAISINKCHSNIVKVCQAKQKSAGGFLWEYADA